MSVKPGFHLIVVIAMNTVVADKSTQLSDCSDFDQGLVLEAVSFLVFFSPFSRSLSVVPVIVPWIIFFL